MKMEIENVRLLGEIQKREDELVRIYLNRLRGEPGLDLRIWYRDEGGELRPTKRGFRIHAELIPEPKAAVDKAIAETGPNDDDFSDQGDLKESKKLESESSDDGDDLPF